MIIKSAEFIASYTVLSKCPEPAIPEYAFIGRSNVGKSSLLNALVNQKGLAKTSATPGKTQLINYFHINNSWYLVDLPGLGFARAPKKLKEKWEKMIKSYFSGRPNLMTIFLLADIRLEPQKVDLQLMEWLAMNNQPFVIVFTKADKIGKTIVDKNLAAYRKTLLNWWEELPLMFISSAETKQGTQEILDYIEQNNAIFEQHKDLIQPKSPL